MFSTTNKTLSNAEAFYIPEQVFSSLCIDIMVSVVVFSWDLKSKDDLKARKLAT